MATMGKYQGNEGELCLDALSLISLLLPSTSVFV